MDDLDKILAEESDDGGYGELDLDDILNEADDAG